MKWALAAIVVLLLAVGGYQALQAVPQALGAPMMAGFKVVECQDAPDARAVYSATDPLTTDGLTLSVPNSARAAGNYAAGCLARAGDPGGGWINRKNSRLQTPGPVLSLMFENGRVSGYPAGKAPTLAPGAPIADPRDLLVVVRNPSMGIGGIALNLMALVHERKLIGAIDGKVEVDGSTFYDDGDRSKPAMRRVPSNYVQPAYERAILECRHAEKLCHLFAELQGSLVLEIWFHDSQRPQARALHDQLRALIGSILTRTPG